MNNNINELNRTEFSPKNSLKSIGVVDPTSAGYFIARRLVERNLNCVGIFTSNPGTPDIDFYRTYRQSEKDFTSSMDGAHLAAVIPGAESGVRLAEGLASRLNLKGNNPLTTDKRRNKTHMAEALRSHSIDVCRQARCGSLEDCLAWAEGTGFPVVVKPEASSGSDLVRVCHSQLQLIEHATAILMGSDKYGQNTNAVLIQEFMAGDEYTVDGVVSDGTLTVFAIGKYRKIDRQGAVIYDKIDFHAFDDLTIDPRIIPYCERVTNAVGVVVGPVHIEIMLTARGPLLVEIAARAHGGIGTSVIDSNFQPSFVDAIIDAYDLSEDRPRDRTLVRRKRAASICFLIANHSGRLAGIPGRDAIQALRSFVEVRWFVGQGQTINKTVDLASCPALIELSHKDPAIIEGDIGLVRELEQNGAMLEIVE
jgi:biotin carboxylase